MVDLFSKTPELCKKRLEQIRRWEASETNSQSKSGKQSTKVTFPHDCIFLAACRANDIEEVSKLLCDPTTNINSATIDGLTALHQAVIDEDAKMVEFLLKSGIDADYTDKGGWTALHAAAQNGYLEIAKILIENGASLDIINVDCDLPIDLATDPEVKQFLKNSMLEKGIDEDEARKSEEHSMVLEARNLLMNSNSEHIDQLDSNTLNKINIKSFMQLIDSTSGASLLHVAASRGYISVIEILLDGGFDIHLKDNDGWTALHAAAHWGHSEACQFLMKCMANPTITNNNGETAKDVADTSLKDLLQILEEQQNNMKEDELIFRISRPSISSRKSSISRLSTGYRNDLMRRSYEEERRLSIQALAAISNENSIAEDYIPIQSQINNENNYQENNSLINKKVSSADEVDIGIINNDNFGDSCRCIKDDNEEDSHKVITDSNYLKSNIELFESTPLKRDYEDYKILNSEMRDEVYINKLKSCNVDIKMNVSHDLNIDNSRVEDFKNRIDENLESTDEDAHLEDENKDQTLLNNNLQSINSNQHSLDNYIVEIRQRRPLSAPLFDEEKSHIESKKKFVTDLGSRTTDPSTWRLAYRQSSNIDSDRNSMLLNNQETEIESNNENSNNIHQPFLRPETAAALATIAQEHRKSVESPKESNEMERKTRAKKAREARRSTGKVVKEDLARAESLNNLKSTSNISSASKLAYGGLPKRESSLKLVNSITSSKQKVDAISKLSNNILGRKESNSKSTGNRLDSTGYRNSDEWSNKREIDSEEVDVLMQKSLKKRLEKLSAPVADGTSQSQKTSNEAMNSSHTCLVNKIFMPSLNSENLETPKSPNKEPEPVTDQQSEDFYISLNNNSSVLYAVNKAESLGKSEFEQNLNQGLNPVNCSDDDILRNKLINPADDNNGLKIRKITDFIDTGLQNNDLLLEKKSIIYKENSQIIDTMKPVNNINIRDYGTAFSKNNALSSGNNTLNSKDKAQYYNEKVNNFATHSGLDVITDKLKNSTTTVELPILTTKNLLTNQPSKDCENSIIETENIDSTTLEKTFNIDQRNPRFVNTNNKDITIPASSKTCISDSSNVTLRKTFGTDQTSNLITMANTIDGSTNLYITSRSLTSNNDITVDPFNYKPISMYNTDLKNSTSSRTDANIANSTTINKSIPDLFNHTTTKSFNLDPDLVLTKISSVDMKSTKTTNIDTTKLTSTKLTISDLSNLTTTKSFCTDSTNDTISTSKLYNNSQCKSSNVPSSPFYSAVHSNCPVITSTYTSLRSNSYIPTLPYSSASANSTNLYCNSSTRFAGGQRQIGQTYQSPFGRSTSLKSVSELPSENKIKPMLDYKRLYEEKQEECEQLRLQLARKDSDFKQIQLQLQSANDILRIRNGSQSREDISIGIDRYRNSDEEKAKLSNKISQLEEQLKAMKYDNSQLKEEKVSFLRLIQNLSKISEN